MPDNGVQPVDLPDYNDPEWFAKRRAKQLEAASHNPTEAADMGLGDLISELASRAVEGEVRSADAWFNSTENRDRIEALAEELNRRGRLVMDDRLNELRIAFE